MAKKKTFKIYMNISKKSMDIRKYTIWKAEAQKSYHSYIDNLIEPDLENRQSNLKQFWSYIKSPRKDKTGLAPLKDKGRLFNAAVDTANILNRQYQSVFTQEEPGEAPYSDGFSYPDITEFMWNTEALTAPQPKESSRSRQSFSLLSQ